MSIAYKAGYKYQLVETYSVSIPIHPVSPIDGFWIQLTPQGSLTIRCGYAWDGPSGPAMDTKSAMRGSLIHDVGYQILRIGLMGPETREDWDALYERVCVEDGMWPLRARLHFIALRKFGWGAAKSSAERPVLTAP